MHIIHEYGVFCEYTVQYVLYTVDVCIMYSVGHSLADCQASKAYEPIRLTRTLHSWQRPANCRLLRSVGLERVGLPFRYSAFAAWFFHTCQVSTRTLHLSVLRSQNTNCVNHRVAQHPVLRGVSREAEHQEAATCCPASELRRYSGLAHTTSKVNA